MKLRVSRRIMFAAPFLAATGAVEGLAEAAEGDFYEFLAGVRRDAIGRGIRASTVDLAFRNAQFLPMSLSSTASSPSGR